MRGTVLGTGSAMPTGGRNQTGLLLEAGGDRLLVDCGSGVRGALADTSGGYESTDTVLLTHHHLDHVSDLLALLKASWLVGEEHLTIVGGRARVDFNHPLAGESVEYEYELLEEVEDTLEQAEGLFSMFLDVDLEMRLEEEEVEETTVEEPDDEDGEPETVTETVEKTTLYIESTPQLAMNQQWMFQKQQIGQQVIDQTGIDRIIIEEVIDGSGMGMGGMMGGMGGMGGGAEGADIEEALEDADIDADELAAEIEE